MKYLSLLSALFVLGISTTTTAFTNTIPFELVGNLIVIKGTVDGQYGNLILDTGVPDLILNNRYFRGKSSGKIFHGINGQIDKVRVSYSEIEIGENYWKGIYAEIIPMQQLEASKGLPILGLLGSKIFWNYNLLIDYEHRNLELFPLDKKGENTDFFRLIPPTEVLRFKFKEWAPLISVQAGALDLKMTVDTGAEISLIREKWLDELPVSQKRQIKKEIGGLGSERKRVRVIHLPGFRVGSLNCQTMRVGVADLYAWNRDTGGPQADGILSNEFLKQFWVAFNFRKREMYLWDGQEPLGRALASIRK